MPLLTYHLSIESGNYAVGLEVISWKWYVSLHPFLFKEMVVEPMNYRKTGFSIGLKLILVLEVVLHTNKEQAANREMFMDKDSGAEMELVDQGSFLEWLAENYKSFGATLEFVSDRS